MFKKPGSMAFYHADGFVPAFKQAMKFAGKGGHVGTMPDAIATRLATDPYKEFGSWNPSDPTPWDTYYTTMTAEYLGVIKERKYVIVAHGIGPMATLEGVLDAYRWHFGDKSRNRTGGRITQAEFEKLANGGYGPVAVIDFEEYRDKFSDDSRFRCPFGYRKVSDAMRDPLLLARLGPRADEYIHRHASFARKYYQTQHSMEVADPFILDVTDAGNLPYWCRDIEEGYAFAHLTSIGGINLVHHQGGPKPPSWACDVSAHEWWNGVRLLGVRAGSKGEVRNGPNAYDLLRKHWRELLEPTGLNVAPARTIPLMKLPDGTWFTQVPKQGARADTYEPEFQVTTMEKVGELERFYTSSNYPVPIFRYDLREAKAVLPQGANAYTLVGDPVRANDGTDRETCLVQGYRVVVDPTKRLMRETALVNDYDRLMALMGVS